MSTSLRPFHLAIPVDDLAAADGFYHGVLKCPHGRRSDHWTDYDFMGHQLVAHLSPDDCEAARRNDVDGEQVPTRHFGVVVSQDQWKDLIAKLQEGGVEFLIGPTIRFKGQPGEQGTFFVRDPAGNALEFKYFDDMGQLFAS